MSVCVCVCVCWFVVVSFVLKYLTCLHIIIIVYCLSGLNVGLKQKPSQRLTHCISPCVDFSLGCCVNFIPRRMKTKLEVN